MAFSASDAAFEGFRVVRRKPMALVFWALLYGLMLAAIFALVGPAMVQMMTLSEQVKANGSAFTTLEDMQPIFQSFATMGVLMAPLSLIVGAVMAAAVSRAVLRPRESAFGYLRLGGDELRVLAVTIVLAIMMFVFMGVGGVIVGVLAGMASQNSALWLVVTAACIALFCVFIWLAVRLCLAVPITVAERRIAIFDSFSLTKGRFWSLLGMALLAFVLSIVVSILGAIVGLPLQMIVGGGIQKLAGMEGQDAATLLQNAWPIILVWVLINAVVSALEVAVIYAPFSAAYLGLTGKSDAQVFE